jgi:hypothetical protein
VYRSPDLNRTELNLRRILQLGRHKKEETKKDEEGMREGNSGRKKEVRKEQNNIYIYIYIAQ